MTVKLDARLIFDYEFFDKIMKGNSDLFWKLMKINAKSKDHKKKHNLISERTYYKITEENTTIKPEYIKASLTRVDDPRNIEDINDEIERNIKYAIHFTSEEPNKVFVITTDEMRPKYMASRHMEGLVDVEILSGDTALRVIENYCNRCLSQDSY